MNSYLLIARYTVADVPLLLFSSRSQAKTEQAALRQNPELIRTRYSGSFAPMGLQGVPDEIPSDVIVIAFGNSVSVANQPQPAAAEADSSKIDIGSVLIGAALGAYFAE